MIKKIDQLDLASKVLREIYNLKYINVPPKTTKNEIP